MNSVARVAVLEETQRYSPRRRMWTRFQRNRFALLGGVLILLVVVAALSAPLVAPYEPSQIDPLSRLSPPSLKHPLGTDSFGRDMLTRILFGARASLSVGFLSVLVLSTVGVLVGALAAFYGKTADQMLMRIVDLLLSVPQFFLLLLIVAMVGPSITTTIFVIGLTSWMGMARLVRGEILALKNREFVVAARAVGNSNWRIILTHLIPNASTVIIVNATLWIAFAIVLEASLSYLGLGTQPPTPTWGNMLTEGRRYMRDAWWIITFPGLSIFLTAISFNLLGDGLRDALDPRAK